MPTHLPEVNSPQVQRIADEDPNYLSAYNICLKYELELAGLEDKQRFVRILGFLLIHAPNRSVRAEVAKCIHSHKDSSDLTDIGAFFEHSVILPFKKYKGRTPKPSQHPSRPSFEVTKEEIKKNITQAPKNHQDAKYRALLRDRWRCMVTGAPERDAPPSERDSTTKILIHTQCAHIIPESTFFRVIPKEKENSKLDYSTSILAVLQRFRYNIQNFEGEHVHSLTNILTLESNVHDAFDQLQLCFEATSEENCYEIKYFDFPPHPDVCSIVTLSSTDPANLPVPAPELLALHATCCKVAHLSGAAEHIDKIYRDADETAVLSADGASADMLSHMLLSLSNQNATAVY
ncbi:hypothetical protein J3R83DRAFT_5497 [Lanmaoa asiatica]|nr:hypothetical protein J3R83DRAFT_5497 [Lanmaoa asiatica]